jgi:hypothetical protein
MARIDLTLGDLQSLDPIEFELVVGEVFKTLGYEVSTTKKTGDGGVDLELVRGRERAVAQCKRFSGTVSQGQIRDFYGTLLHAGVAKGYFVTSGMFSLAATTWASGKPIALSDGPDLLAALSNGGVQIPFHPLPPTTGTDVLKLVHSALTQDVGRKILIEGPPPAGVSYRGLREALDVEGGGYVSGSTAKEAYGWLDRARRQRPSVILIDE